ncbi:hypothetical protein IB277_10695 [Ensifer sp. ENS07]|nr:hypothetical protein [Ensifer sp. ENS07]
MQSDDADAMLPLKCGNRIISRFLPISPSTSHVLPLGIYTQGLPERITARRGVEMTFRQTGTYRVGFSALVFSTLSYSLVTLRSHVRRFPALL